MHVVLSKGWSNFLQCFGNIIDNTSHEIPLLSSWCLQPLTCLLAFNAACPSALLPAVMPAGAAVCAWSPELFAMRLHAHWGQRWCQHVPLHPGRHRRLPGGLPSATTPCNFATSITAKRILVRKVPIHVVERWSHAKVVGNMCQPYCIACPTPCGRPSCSLLPVPCSLFLAS